MFRPGLTRRIALLLLLMFPMQMAGAALLACKQPPVGEPRAMIGADSSSCHNQRAQNDGDNMAAFSCAKCAFGCVLSFHSGEQKPAVFVAFYESILTVQYLSVRYISPDPQTETPPPTA